VDDVAAVGSYIREGQVVGAIESMKLLNDVVSSVTGTVIEAMVEDGLQSSMGSRCARLVRVSM